MVGSTCCNGHDACQGIQSANMTLLHDSCNSISACRGATGKKFMK